MVLLCYLIVMARHFHGILHVLFMNCYIQKKLPTQIGIASIFLDNNTQIGVYPFLRFLTVWFVVSFISPEKSKLSWYFWMLTTLLMVTWKFMWDLDKHAMWDCALEMILLAIIWEAGLQAEVSGQLMTKTS
jgi:hypothetical protein